MRRGPRRQCPAPPPGVTVQAWKAQHGSLLSASAEAMFSELGVSNHLFPMNATEIAPADLAPVVKFLQACSPIAPDVERAASESSQLGHLIFINIRCGICHVESLKTGREGEQIVGSVVPHSLVDVTIHPYTDLLLHDVGTGDGIIENIRPQDYDEATANKFRPPTVGCALPKLADARWQIHHIPSSDHASWRRGARRSQKIS